MDKLEAAIAALHEIDAEAGVRRGQDTVAPAARLIVSIGFLLATVSFDKYDLSGLLGMSLYLIITAVWEEISVKKGLLRLRYIMIMILLLGAANVFYDRDVVFAVGRFRVTGGMLSMATLAVKGIFSVYAAYFLFLTVGMNGLCAALGSLRIPKSIVTVVLLTYRYVIVLLKETRAMIQAYALRSCGQPGIRVPAWGSFAGLLLLRSMDRAGDVYDSMLLRGYDGDAFGAAERKHAGKRRSIMYAAIWLCVFTALRTIPVFRLAGALFASM